MYNVFGMNISHRYSRLFFAVGLCCSCCSKRLSEIWPRLDSRHKDLRGHTKESLAGSTHCNSVQLKSWLQRTPDIQGCQYVGGIMKVVDMWPAPATKEGILVIIALTWLYLVLCHWLHDLPKCTIKNLQNRRKYVWLIQLVYCTVGTALNTAST